MQKKFISNLILLLFLNLLVKPAWIFGIDLPVQNRVGAEEYGLYFALFNFSMLFNILLDLGLTHYNNQAVSRNRPEVVRNFSNLTSLKFMLGVVYLVVTLVAGFVFGYSQTALILLLILSFNARDPYPHVGLASLCIPTFDLVGQWFALGGKADVLAPGFRLTEVEVVLV